MVTQEFIAYVRVELNKGKDRESIRGALLSGGGWTEDDISEVFREIIPMENKTAPEPVLAPMEIPAPPMPSEGVMIMPRRVFSLRSFLKSFLIFLILALVCYAGWYYRSRILAFPAEMKGAYNFLLNKINSPAKIVSENNPILQPDQIVSVKDCGTSMAPDRKVIGSYNNNAVLNCLGQSALACATGAKAVLTDSLFPTIFEIKNDQGICEFKLSYSQDSALVDTTGKKLAGQSIICPVSLVQEGIDNPSIYAAQIYFYGTLGLFVENNLDQNKIENLGCSGSYIQSVIKSYQ